MDAAREFRIGVEARDLDRMMACFADDARLFSPAYRKPFEGKEAIEMLLSVLLGTFEDFTYSDELAGGDTSTALIFTARVGKLELQGLDLIRIDKDGLIAEFTVMIRPFRALESLMERVTEEMTAALQAAE